MNPKLVILHGLEIAYYEKPGTAGTILFIHGNSGNALSFQLMWNSPSLKTFHLIAVDLPGHGNSARSTDHSNYKLLSCSKIVAALLDKLGLERVVILGHSLGGHIAIHTAQYTNCVAGVLINGAAPIANGMDIQNGYSLNEDILVLFKFSATDEEMERAFAVGLHNRKYDHFFGNAYAMADGHFREVLAADLSTFYDSLEFVSEITILNSPRLLTAIVVGEFERLVNFKYLASLQIANLWGGKVHVIEEAGHCPPYENPEALSKLTAEFALAVRDHKR